MVETFMGALFKLWGLSVVISVLLLLNTIPILFMCVYERLIGTLDKYFLRVTLLTNVVLVGSVWAFYEYQTARIASGEIAGNTRTLGDVANTINEGLPHMAHGLLGLALTVMFVLMVLKYTSTDSENSRSKTV